MDVIGDESFMCTAEEIALLDIKLNLGELAVKSWKLLEKEKKTTNVNKHLSEWLKQYICCSNGPVNSIRTYIKENEEVPLPSCPLPTSC